MKLGNVKIEAVLGDLTEQKDITAIVNAANAQLQMGGGVAGAIHTAAGKELAEECQPLAPIRPGQAAITQGYKLPNEYVIHVLGPVYGFNQNDGKLLSNCYENALKLAEEYKIESIAFPSISTGAFGYPFEEATDIALSTVKKFTGNAKSVKLIRFVLFSEQDYEFYKNQLSSIK